MMTTCRVEVDKDQVLLILPFRANDLILKPDVAERLAEDIHEKSNLCETWIKAGGSRIVIKGKPWSALIKSWDGRVNVRFSQTSNKVQLPYEIARKLADEIQSKVVEARYFLTLDVQAVATNV